MKWISVEKKLPTDGEGVLGFWGDTGSGIDWRNFAVTLYSNGAWLNPEDDENDYSKPTHWMPLPAAPKSP